MINVRIFYICTTNTSTMKNLLHYLLIGVLATYSSTISAQGADNPENKPLVSVEQMPQFPGGDEALLNFIKENLKYPAEAAKVGIEGRVTVRFVVGEDGKVRDVVVVRGLDSTCNQEAVRVVKLMPTWIPGEANGRKVPVYYTLPIVYRIPKGDPLLFVDGRLQPYAMMRDTTKLRPSDIKTMNVLKEALAIERYGEKGKYGAILIETKEHAAKLENDILNDKPVYGVEVMPQFPGGEEALLDFIKNNLRYPSSDAQVGIQGRTTVRFVVNKLGQVCDITVIRSLSKACDAEAVRVIKMMPNWIPGKQQGKPVSVYYTLPIVYKLQR
jgi:TonB family protein